MLITHIRSVLETLLNKRLVHSVEIQPVNPMGTAIAGRLLSVFVLYL